MSCGTLISFCEKKLGRTPKNNPHFLDFSKKRGLKKHVFSQLAEISDIDFKKKHKIVDFYGPRPRNVFGKLSIKKIRHTKNFGQDDRHRQFTAYMFEKTFFRFLFFRFLQ